MILLQGISQTCFQRANKITYTSMFSSSHKTTSYIPRKMKMTSKDTNRFLLDAQWAFSLSWFFFYFKLGTDWESYLWNKFFRTFDNDWGSDYLGNKLCSTISGVISKLDTTPGRKRKWPQYLIFQLIFSPIFVLFTISEFSRKQWEKTNVITILLLNIYLFWDSTAVYSEKPILVTLLSWTLKKYRKHVESLRKFFQAEFIYIES